MGRNRFFKLIVWEFEQFLSFPVVELLIASTVFLVLYRPITNQNFSTIWDNLHMSNNFLILFIIFIACALFSRSFAGTIDKGEIKMLLSYPIKRWGTVFREIHHTILCVVCNIRCNLLFEHSSFGA